MSSSDEDDSPWETIEFSVNLIEAAMSQLEFLREVDENVDLFKKYYIKRAIYRYERYWIPLYIDHCKNGNYDFLLIPPIDVEWVWHVHMLSPIEYIKDCKSMCGHFIGHEIPTNDERLKYKNKSKYLWEKETKVPYDYKEDTVYHGNSETKIKYDIESANERQKSFFYQVSLPHFMSKDFLKLGVTRYQKFLYLKKMYPKEFITPCYLIDIIWHSHQLHPSEYKNDTIAVLGKILPHDDSTNDRSPNSKLTVSSENTILMWKTLYNEDFFQEGAMFRGDKPNKRIIGESNINFEGLMIRRGSVKFLNIKIDVVNSANNTPTAAAAAAYIPKFEIEIKNIHHQKESVSAKIQTNSMNLISVPKQLLYSTYDDIVPISISIDECFKSFKLIKGIFSEKVRESKLRVTFFSQINVSYLKNTKQEFKFKFNHEPTNTNYLLSFQTETEIVSKTEFLFNITKGKFENISLRECERFLQRINPLLIYKIDQNESKIVKAKHDVCSSNFALKYNIEIFYMQTPPLSAIQISHNDKVVAVAKLIGSEQLPSRIYADSISLNPKTERAMLVQISSGDYAILKGEWVDRKRGFAGDYYSRGVPGNPGHLRVTYYSFLNIKTIIIEEDNTGFMQFNDQDNGFNASIDLKKGKISLIKRHVETSEACFEGFLASVFSIAVLHLLIQPKYKPEIINKYQSRGMVFVAIDYGKKYAGYEFLLAAGYLNVLEFSNSINCHNCDMSIYYGDTTNFFNCIETLNSDGAGGGCGGCGGCGGGGCGV